MDKMKKIVEEKRNQSGSKKPKYAMRKLSVGLVSCVLGYLTFASPQTVMAETDFNDSLIESSGTERSENLKDIDKLFFDEIYNSKLELSNNETLKNWSKFESESTVTTNNENEISSTNENDLKNDNPSKLVETLEPKKDILTLFDEDKIAENLVEMIKKQDEKTDADKDRLEINSEALPDAIKAVEKEKLTDENKEKTIKPKYKESEIVKDENNIKNYRQSDIAGQGPKVKVTKDNIGEEKEGVRVEVQNPSSTSDDKKSFGVELNIDKTKADRTYNGFEITDSVRGVKTEGVGGFLSKGESLPTNKEDKVTYEPNDPEEGSLIPGRQTRFEYSSTQKDREHIANQNTGKTTMAWQGKYNSDNPNQKMFEGSTNFEVTVGVNPYPNENKDLSLIGIVGNTTISKAPVKNQYIVSDANITNAGEEDYTRLVGEVYHPDEDIIVEGAKALVVTPENIENMKKETGDNTLTIGQIVFKMPEGALQNNNSIFNDNKFKGVQNLRAKFFARPRTKEEFSKLANTLKASDDDTTFGYVSTGAGTKKIIHNGTEVEIDEQGIARYDHYNLIGEMTINLDDTKHYNPEFINQAGEKTSENEYTSVKPGETSKVEFSKKFSELSGGLEGVGEDSKLNDYVNKGYATGIVSETFLKEINKGKPKNKQWNIKLEKGDKEQLTVEAPKDAKPGEFVAIPVIYTYTNGSQDVKWFHFVVQDNENHRPEYKADIGYQGDKLVNTPEIPTDPEGTKKEDKKKTPQSFELAKPAYTDENGNELEAGKYKKKDGTIIDLKPGEYVDSAGNVWTDVEINPKTGEVTATVPKDVNIEGGENLFVPVKVTYEDGKSIDVSSQFIARPRYYENDTHEVKSEIPFDTNVVYDDKLEAGVVVKTEGEVGEKQTIYEWSFDSLEKDLSKRVLVSTTETVVKEKKDAEIRIGIKPAEEKVTIPHTIEYIVDPSLKPGEEVVAEEGSDGEITVKTTRDSQTGKISITKEETTAMTPMKVKVGVYNHTNKDPFETKVVEDNSLPAGKIVTETEGIVGETETKVIPAKIADMDDMMKTIGEDKFLGENNTPNYDAIANYMVKKGFWDKDKIKKTTGEDGKVTAASYDGKRFEELLNFNAKNNPTGKVLVPGRVETKEKTKKQDKIIKVGTKTPDKVTSSTRYDIPFETEIVYNSEKDAGTVTILQDGKAGLVEDTVETVYDKDTNTLINNKTGKEVKARKRIIEIGTKNICPVPPVAPIEPGHDAPDIPSQVTPQNPGDNISENLGGGDIPKKEPKENIVGGKNPTDSNIKTPNTEVTVTYDEQQSTKSKDEQPNGFNEKTSKLDVDGKQIENIDGKQGALEIQDKIESASVKTSNKSNGDEFAPQTSDNGIVGYAVTGVSAALALSFLEIEKRKRK